MWYRLSGKKDVIALWNRKFGEGNPYEIIPWLSELSSVAQKATVQLLEPYYITNKERRDDYINNPNLARRMKAFDYLFQKDKIKDLKFKGDQTVHARGMDFQDMGHRMDHFVLGATSFPDFEPEKQKEFDSKVAALYEEKEPVRDDESGFYAYPITNYELSKQCGDDVFGDDESENRWCTTTDENQFRNHSEHEVMWLVTTPENDQYMVTTDHVDPKKKVAYDDENTPHDVENLDWKERGFDVYALPEYTVPESPTPISWSDTLSYPEKKARLSNGIINIESIIRMWNFGAKDLVLHAVKNQDYSRYLYELKDDFKDLRDKDILIKSILDGAANIKTRDLAHTEDEDDFVKKLTALMEDAYLSSHTRLIERLKDIENHTPYHKGGVAISSYDFAIIALNNKEFAKEMVSDDFWYTPDVGDVAETLIVYTTRQFGYEKSLEKSVEILDYVYGIDLAENTEDNMSFFKFLNMAEKKGVEMEYGSLGLQHDLDLLKPELQKITNEYDGKELVDIAVNLSEKIEPGELYQYEGFRNVWDQVSDRLLKKYIDESSTGSVYPEVMPFFVAQIALKSITFYVPDHVTQDNIKLVLDSNPNEWEMNHLLSIFRDARVGAYSPMVLDLILKSPSQKIVPVTKDKLVFMLQHYPFENNVKPFLNVMDISGGWNVLLEIVNDALQAEHDHQELLDAIDSDRNEVEYFYTRVNLRLKEYSISPHHNADRFDILNKHLGGKLLSMIESSLLKVKSEQDSMPEKEEAVT